MQFRDIPGQEQVKSTLIRSVHNNHVAHAQMFFGPEGSGALPLAIAYSTFINCTNKQENDSCGECPSCHKMKKLIHPDVHFIYPFAKIAEKGKDISSASFIKEWRDITQGNPYFGFHDWAEYINAENKQFSIPVDESRKVVRTLSLKAFEGEYKMMILWLPELMHTSAANALLKVLEEPPEKTVFILVANDPDAVISTIISRVQQVKVIGFSDDEIATALREKYDVDEKQARHLAYVADGNMNEALRQVNNVEEEQHDLFRNWMRSCYKKNNFDELVSWSDNFQGISKEGQKSFLQYGLGVLRESLIMNNAGRELLRLADEELKFVEGFSKVLTNEKVEVISGELTRACYHLERNAHPKIMFFDLSLTISGILKQ